MRNFQLLIYLPVIVVIVLLSWHTLPVACQRPNRNFTIFNNPPHYVNVVSQDSRNSVNHKASLRTSSSGNSNINTNGRDSLMPGKSIAGAGSSASSSRSSRSGVTETPPDNFNELDASLMATTRIPPARRGGRRQSQQELLRRRLNRQKSTSLDALKKEISKVDASVAAKAKNNPKPAFGDGTGGTSTSYGGVIGMGVGAGVSGYPIGSYAPKGKPPVHGPRQMDIGNSGMPKAGGIAGLSEISSYPAQYPPTISDKGQMYRPKGTKSGMSELLLMKHNQRLSELGDDPSLQQNTRSHYNDDRFNDSLTKIKMMTNPYQPEPDTIHSGEIEDTLGVKCDFESWCGWKWDEHLDDGFQVVTGNNLTRMNLTGIMPGPSSDWQKDAKGHFLYARILPNTTQVNLTSPQFSATMDKCRIQVWMHQSSMAHGLSRIVIEPLQHDSKSWVPSEILGNNLNSWEPKIYRIGRVTPDFRIAFEIVPSNVSLRGHIAIDNIRMVNCFPERTGGDKCNTSQVKCMESRIPVCMPLSRICDITRDCDDGEDEMVNCEKIPYGGQCDFDDDWCGWYDSGKTILQWSRHSGRSPTEDTGPESDHTYLERRDANRTGFYMLVDMNQHAHNENKMKIGLASNAILMSKIFNPPPPVHNNLSSPYTNSCVVRFYFHQFGKNHGSINLSLVELKAKENVTTTLWRSAKNHGADWQREEWVLPRVTSRYYLQFEARMGMRIYSDVAVDDVSLSPECFGLNIPPEHLNGYNYWNVRKHMKTAPHKDFNNKNFMELTTCDTRGVNGPTSSQCEHHYRTNNNSHILSSVRIVEDQTSFKGMQKWKVPSEGYYTFIAKGAGGGLGSAGVGSSRGAVAISVLELHKNEELYFLIGQQGENACIKSFGNKEGGCGPADADKIRATETFHSKAHMIKSIKIEDGAGGGGGGSFIFLLNSAKNEAVPLIVAGGGGGLGIGQYLDEEFQHGRGIVLEQTSVSGQVHAESVNLKTAGPGGGWKAKEDTALGPRNGAALLQGGRGGVPCYADSLERLQGQGGFGGGGGGCNTGGGGGGYAGGDVYLNETNGQGGTSYISTSRSLKKFNVVDEGANTGPGSVTIIAAIVGCGCDYRCIVLDEYRSNVQCICPEGWRPKRDNNTACEIITADRIQLQHWVMFFVCLSVALVMAVAWLILILYGRYQQKKQAAQRHKMLIEQDLQLSRLRNNADDSALTNFNPNYGCDGILNGNVDVKSLPQVARESLRLVKALGQGAFGEVYQGLYRHRDGDAVEMPVAVKTLPEMSTGQAEADFLMEAAIMAKFNHPNIVHLIGVCFDRHPRFIVLELLAGGDLKNFLREGRNKPERPSALTMKDLVFCALDVAKGCRYMESKRFIHRDIAARNCLLSSKGPGRVVKIADFGMARDIYRSDYYRKGGKAMLPIKWMPPEAFLDGIFTSKTDVWSFGVLLWEVFSLGLMPYTGLPNRDVMQLVTSGGRLDAPPGCPAAIYRIMAECWNPTPEERPPFSNLLERLTVCTQESEVMNAPLPSIFRPASTERDQTIMRPPGNGDYCLQVPNSSDYLIPLPGPRGIAERLLSEGTGITIPETLTTCTSPVMTSPSKFATQDHPGCWETSFIMPSSKSDQPLLSTHTNEAQSNGVDCAYTFAHNGNGSLPQQRLGGTRKALDDEEPRLISLDTPQPTPTTVTAPLSFSQLEGITLNPGALTATTNTTTTNPSINKQSYANIQMVNSETPNGPTFDGSNNATIGGGNTSATASVPFTVQGFNDRYNANLNKDTHSEISC